MFPCWLLADGVARREPEQRATRWVGTYRTVSVSSLELVSSNLDQVARLASLLGDSKEWIWGGGGGEGGSRRGRLGKRRIGSADERVDCDHFAGDFGRSDRVSAGFLYGTPSFGGALIWGEADGAFYCGDTVGGVAGSSFDLCAEVEGDAGGGDGRGGEKLSNEIGGGLCSDGAVGTGCNKDGAETSGGSESDCLDSDGGGRFDFGGRGLAEEACWAGKSWVGSGLGDWGFADAGGGLSGNFPLWGIDFGGDVCGIIEVGGNRLFLFAGDSDPFCGLWVKFLSAVEVGGGAGAGGVATFGAGFCGFGGDGVLGGAVVAGVCAEQDVQPLWMVPDWSGVGLVGAGVEAS